MTAVTANKEPQRDELKVVDQLRKENWRTVEWSDESVLKYS